MADYVDKERETDEMSSNFDLKSLWMMFIMHWQWFVLSVLLCLAGAFVYLRFKQPTYSADVKILIKEVDEGAAAMTGAMDLSQFGVVSNTNGFNNELEIISSKNLAIRTVKSLKLYVNYRLGGTVRDTEIYKNSPFLVDIEENRLEDLETPISLEITEAKEGVVVKTKVQRLVGEEYAEVESEEVLKELPGTLRLPEGVLMIQRNPGGELKGKTLFVDVMPLRSVARRYVGALSVSPTSKTTTVAQLRVVDTNVGRALDYLSELVKSYNIDANEDKNEVARKTEEFINERIEMIRRELDNTEGSLESYKKANELINLKNDATAALSTSGEYQQKQVEMQTQITLVKALIEYVSNPKNALGVIPMNLGLENAVLNNQISKYNEVVAQRNRLVKASSESSPAVLEQTEILTNMGDVILQSMRTMYSELQVQKRSIDQQYALYMGKVSKTPSQERILNNIGRQQEIQAGLYLMLLQKREENSISLASTATKARVIDAPEFVGKVAPRNSMIYLMALVLGMGIPFGVLFLINLLRYRIEGRQDVERLSDVPLLADIPLRKNLDEGEHGIVVRENKNDMMEEAFRGLRTNLRFILTGNEKVILITSVIPGEGKTFVSTNLAMSLALLGKKVLLIGLDIRKPRLVKLFGLKQDKRGITAFLAGENDDVEFLKSQITHGVMQPTLDVLPAGVIPPNPAELITRDMLDKAFAHFREMYDYVIVDTPPVGVVSDTLEISRVSDVAFFVCRADHSLKSNFALINSIKQADKMPKMNLVLNGVDLSKKKYGYYYGYGKYGRYGNYSRYSRLGHYGTYGSYGSNIGGSTER